MPGLSTNFSVHQATCSMFHLPCGLGASPLAPASVPRPVPARLDLNLSCSAASSVSPSPFLTVLPIGICVRRTNWPTRWSVISVTIQRAGEGKPCLVTALLNYGFLRCQRIFPVEENIQEEIRFAQSLSGQLWGSVEGVLKLPPASSVLTSHRRERKKRCLPSSQLVSGLLLWQGVQNAQQKQWGDISYFPSFILQFQAVACGKKWMRPQTEEEPIQYPRWKW